MQADVLGQIERRGGAAWALIGKSSPVLWPIEKVSFFCSDKVGGSASSLFTFHVKLDRGGGEVEKG